MQGFFRLIVAYRSNRFLMKGDSFLNVARLSLPLKYIAQRYSKIVQMSSSEFGSMIDQCEVYRLSSG